MLPPRFSAIPLASAQWVSLLALFGVACGGEDASSPAAGDAEGSPSSDVGAISPDPDEAEGAPGSDVDENGELLIDDLEDGDDKFTLQGVEGEWFTYSDETAEVLPPPHMGVGDTPGELHVTGQGFSEWGVAVAAYFQYSDLSDFQGVKVRLKGSGQIRFELSTADTLPLDHDGTCEEGCYGHFATLIDLPAEYEDVTILFSELAQPSWATAAEMSLERVGQVDFLSPGSAESPAAIDLWIDRLSLVAAEPQG